MIRPIALTAVMIVAPVGAAAHKLLVFASVDCEIVTVEAKFSNGRIAQQGDIRVLDGTNTEQATLSLNTAGTAQFPLASVDHSGGLVIEVNTGTHDNYWIVTPEDIARNCRS